MMLRYILTFASSAVLMAGAASAAIVSIPGAAFKPSCPTCIPLGQFPDLQNGSLTANGLATLSAPVDFPVDGQKICRMTLVYEDKNGTENLTMRLLRKTAANGANPDAPPAVLAQVSSSGSVAASTRKASTTAISPRMINEAGGFYYVETSFINVNLNIIGVQLDVRGVCP